MKKHYLIIILLSALAFISPSSYAQDADNEFVYPQEDESALLVEPVKNEIEAFNPLEINPDESVFKTETIRYDVLNPSFSASYYPGGRGPNKLVIYSPKYGKHTGTNEFGTEAVVEGNVVTSLSGADSMIPQNGIVISGHGTAKNWITKNITVGSKVYVDTVTGHLTVYITSDSYTYEVKNKINEAKSIINYYKNKMSNYDPTLPENHIHIAENYLKMAENEKKNYTAIKNYTKEAITEADMAIKTSLPYIKNEMRGTWIRPTETTREQIIATLDNLKANGFNNIFLETYFHGKTIYPSQTMNKYGFTVQNEAFTGFDPLEVWVSEAHKRGIRVHIWFQSFYVGNKNPKADSSSILSVRPDWGNKTKRYADIPGATMSVSEHNGYFIDPANPEIQTFLLELIDEIITTYHPDGINLDYVRYPNANARSIQNSWGYTAYARNEFKEEFGTDPINLTMADVGWYDWNQYRRNKITEFVEKVGKLGNEKHTYISAVIFPDIASALSTKQQDWRSWSQNAYIDGFTPLFLTFDSNMLASMMNDVQRTKSPDTELYAGLFVTFMGGAPEDLIRQIHQSRMLNSNGVILFDWAHTGAQYTSTLMASTFNERSATQTRIAKNQKKKTPEREEKRKEQRPQGKVVVTTSGKGSWVFTRSDK